jgi:hypothetical protein
MMATEYATLEEAFGIRSFSAPQPPVLRGDVATVQKQRYERMDDDIQKAYDHSVGTRVAVSPPRAPVDANRCGVIADAHAAGGAKAAWDAIPECAKWDMMWYAVRELVASEFLTMLLVATCLYLLLR